MLKFDDFDLAVRSLTNGENTVIVDDKIGRAHV